MAIIFSGDLERIVRDFFGTNFVYTAASVLDDDDRSVSAHAKMRTARRSAWVDVAAALTPRL